MNKREFVLDTLLPYKEDLSTRAFDGGSCLYLTADGNKCAVGKHMVEGPWQKKITSIKGLVEHYTFEQMLTPEAFAMGFNLNTWAAIQRYHDNLFNNLNSIQIFELNLVVIGIEDELGIKLPELILKEI